MLKFKDLNKINFIEKALNNNSISPNNKSTNSNSSKN